MPPIIFFNFILNFQSRSVWTGQKSCTQLKLQLQLQLRKPGTHCEKVDLEAAASCWTVKTPKLRAKTDLMSAAPNQRKSSAFQKKTLLLGRLGLGSPPAPSILFSLISVCALTHLLYGDLPR